MIPMNVRRLLAAASLAALTLAPMAARAGTYDGNTLLCRNGAGLVGAAFNGVENAINAGVFKRAGDQSNLLIKLAAANQKTLQNKFGDAIDKLDDISSAATALANAAKPKLDSADGINAAVLTAVACLAG